MPKPRGTTLTLAGRRPVAWVLLLERDPIPGRGEETPPDPRVTAWCGGSGPLRWWATGPGTSIGYSQAALDHNERVVMSWAWIVVSAVVGALLGPSLRTQILRYSVESTQSWRRGCPHCDHQLIADGWRALATVLPVTGGCPSCRQRLGPPTGTVEVTTAAVLALLTWRIGEVLPLLAFGWTFCLGVVLAFVDWRVRRLPDRLTFSAAGGAAVLLATAAALHGEPGRLLRAGACALGVALFYLVLVLISPSGMGLGDAKMALATGLVTGWISMFAAVSGAVTGFVLAGGYGVFLVVTRRADPKDHFAQGPFMLMGAFVAVVTAGL